MSSLGCPGGTAVATVAPVLDIGFLPSWLATLLEALTVPAAVALMLMQATRYQMIHRVSGHRLTLTVWTARQARRLRDQLQPELEWSSRARRR